MSLFPTHAWLDGLLEAVWLVDEKSLCILQVNKAAERLAGLPGSDMVGKPVTSLAATPQDHAFWAEPKATLAAGIHSHTSMLRADGVTLPLFRVALNPRFTRPFYAVPRTSAARTASG